MARVTLCILTVFGLLTTAGFAAQLAESLKPGHVELQSVSSLAFGPEGILFVGDSFQGTVFAIDTEDTQPAAAPVRLTIRGLNEQIAARLGTVPDDVLINDVKVNPVSKNVYVALSRGRGPDAIPVILRIDALGTMHEFSLEQVNFSVTSLNDAPESDPDARRTTPNGPVAGNPRVQTITDMAYVDGKVLVAGLSNEEFASNLRAIPFPFPAGRSGAGIRIWHAAHGRYETDSPVRTFVPYTINNESHILAAYTCTPLVKIPVSQLEPGARVTGTTIAELGTSNRPLDMVAYTQNDRQYILMANSKRGVMKLTADGLEDYSAIEPATPVCEAASEPERGPRECRSDISGVPYETLSNLDGVWQLAKVDDTHVLVIADSSGSPLDLGAGQATWSAPVPGSSLDLLTLPLP